jgi:glutamate/tyrosine decarboxylase-like PLP-dependent enzyme
MKTIPDHRFPEIPERELRREAEAAAWLAAQIDASEHFERLSQRPVSAIWFRFAPPGHSAAELDAMNASLAKRMSSSSDIRLRETTFDGRVALGLAVSGAGAAGEQVRQAWDHLSGHAAEIRRERA